ncbi:unnamed protein product [Urochloa humidicola]
MAITPSFPLAVAVAVLAVVSRTADATIESTCAAAAARDRRVDIAFCARQFASYHGAAESGPWGLARTAALIGVNLGDDAAYDVGEGKVEVVRPPPPGGAGDMGEAALRECARAYDVVGMAFAEAADGLGARRYAAAEERFARVAALARWCEGALAVAGELTPPALARYSAECQQMALIGIAITDLIK